MRWVGGFVRERSWVVELHTTWVRGEVDIVSGIYYSVGKRLNSI
jgi:hypothetical protein